MKEFQGSLAFAKVTAHDIRRAFEKYMLKFLDEKQRITVFVTSPDFSSTGIESQRTRLKLEGKPFVVDDLAVELK